MTAPNALAVPFAGPGVPQAQTLPLQRQENSSRTPTCRSSRSWRIPVVLGRSFCSAPRQPVPNCLSRGITVRRRSFLLRGGG